MGTDNDIADEKPSDDLLWQRLIDLHIAWFEAQEAFLREAKAPLAKVQRVMAGPKTGNDHFVAMALLSRMKTEDRMDVFPQLLISCLSPKWRKIAQSLILSIPKEWLLANIETVSKPLIERADYQDYFALLRLFKEIDLSLATKLALEAATSSDEEIREIGEDFLRDNK